MLGIWELTSQQSTTLKADFKLSSKNSQASWIKTNLTLYSRLILNMLHQKANFVPSQRLGTPRSDSVMKQGEDYRLPGFISQLQ